MPMIVASPLIVSSFALQKNTHKNKNQKRSGTISMQG